MNKALVIPALLLGAACVHAAQATTIQAAAAPTSLKERLQAYVDAHVATGRFAGAVLVTQNGRTIFQRGFGLADREQRIPNLAWTKFKIGSITKSFTAAAVLRLQAQGKLNVHDKLSKFLPDFPQADQITLHQLLNHTAGLSDLAQLPQFSALKTTPTTLDATIAFLKTQPSQTAGTAFHYSNSGYILLSKVIEVASGQPYDEVLNDLLKSARLTQSGYASGRQLTPGLAHGYEFTGYDYLNAAHIDMSLPVGSGGMYSTAADLDRWLTSLDQGAVLGRQGREQLLGAHAPAVASDEPGATYGYGMYVGKHAGRTYFGHGGAIDGFANWMQRFPEQKLNVIVLSNVQGGPVKAMGRDIASLVFGQDVELPQPRPVLTLTPQRIAQLVGTYDVPNLPTLTLTATGARLKLSVGGQPAFDLLAETPAKFYSLLSPAEFETLERPGGVVTGIKVTVGGMVVEGVKRP